MIERLMPSAVAVASTRGDLPAELSAAEQAAVGRAVARRQQEFTTGRACARLALRRLGVDPVAIPSGERGEPVWPDGVVGSITHCRGYRACAVAKADEVLALGVDAEVHEPLPAGVLEQVAFGRERAMCADRVAGVHLDRLLFSAKEAVYKVWFPLTRQWLGFEDVELAVDAQGGTFRARLLVAGPVVAGARLTELRGRWCVEDGLVATAVALLP
ncbi:MAG TPA: 4'-phosphopantetheinyl transferase superfamily protein [Conexibacter sp.]|nr:4'-phosphopantetheinyl transferase superfamily protein [Conexibacter sp.]